jgi:hypothetical protein
MGIFEDTPSQAPRSLLTHPSLLGFFQLENLVSDDAPPHQVLRVLLVDAEATMKSGGGRKCTAREYATHLGLADIIVDSRAPILQSVKHWLGEQRSWNPPKYSFFTFRSPKKPIIFETPNAGWFDAARLALQETGYTVMDMSYAEKIYGSIDGIPMLVYENNTQDTIHTVRRLLLQGIVHPDNVVALCPTHHGLVELEEGQSSKIACICSSDIFDNLLGRVRRSAVLGLSSEEIQKMLDNDNGAILGSPCFSSGRKRLGFPPL